MTDSWAAIDSNSKATLTARLKTDALTIKRLIAETATGALAVTTSTAGTVTPASFAATDGNSRPTIFAVSENDENVLVALQCDSTGALLVKLV